MQVAKKIASNTIYQTIGKVATMGTTVLVTMLVTRRYGVDGFGRLSIILTFPSLFYVVADFGMNAIVAGEITKKPKQVAELFNNLLSLRLLFTLVLILLGTLLLQFFPYDSQLKLFATLALPSVALFGIYTSTNAVFQANFAYNRSMIAPIGRSITVLALVLLLMSRGVSIVYLTTAYVVGDTVMGGLSLALVKAFVNKVKLVKDSKVYQYIAISAFPLGMAAITNPIIGKADTLLISVLKNESAVGFYSLSYKIFEVFLVVPVFFVNAAYPYMVGHYKQSLEKLNATAKKLAIVLLLGGFTATGLVWLLAPWFVQVLGGAGFEPSILALRILALSFPIFFSTNIILWYLITIGKRKAIPVIYWLAVVFNIGANLLVIPSYSFTGAAVINGLTEVFVLISLVFLAVKETPLSVDKGV